jgi:aminopeptidase
MKDPRIKKLAENLLNYSCKLEKGQSIIIEGNPESKDLIVELVRQIYKIGAYPFVRLGNEQISREIMMGITEDLSKRMCKYTLPMFQECDAYIGIGAYNNAFESSDVPAENKALHAKHYGKPIHMDTRAVKHKWVILHWPNASFAQMAQTSLEGMENFYFEVCNMNYEKMAKAMVPLKDLIEKTDKVRIVAPDTDLTFSIKGQKAKICSGECNIPDGEIYTAPLRTSINGKIHFNTPSLCKGTVHHDITLTFSDGKVIEASSSDTKALLVELDSDDGARYTGEFAFGVNPYITKPMNDTLFDEKIGGSIHIALGNCYDDCPNGNKSQIHWDIVLQGGEIYFDDKLIRKDGRFVIKELLGLNPENLK